MSKQGIGNTQSIRAERDYAARRNGDSKLFHTASWLAIVVSMLGARWPFLWPVR
jgi:hypothetical protein